MKALLSNHWVAHLGNIQPHTWCWWTYAITNKVEQTTTHMVFVELCIYQQSAQSTIGLLIPHVAFFGEHTHNGAQTYSPNYWLTRAENNAIDNAQLTNHTTCDDTCGQPPCQRCTRETTPSTPTKCSRITHAIGTHIQITIMQCTNIVHKECHNPTTWHIPIEQPRMLLKT